MKKAHRPASHLFQRTALWAALSLSMLGSAQALTLGRPVVQSKQGEALRAEIDIREISAAEEMDLQATLASPDLYKAAKIEPPQSNNAPLDIDVQLARRSNGKLYLKVNSKQAIQGNALDLLIDLRWATGRLLRDFSLSLDDNKAAKNSTPLPALAQSSNSKGDAPIAVQRGDTASELMAGKTPAGVSLEQMLVALLRNNPDAFVDANVNRMKAGALLTLPTEQEARAISRDEARREIQIQSKDFDTYRANLAARAPGGSAPQASRDSVGKLEAKVQNNSKANQDKLTLTKPNLKEAAAEEKIAQQREAQDVATRAAELSRNISELGQIAAATLSSSAASEPAPAVSLPIEEPASAASVSAWLDELTDNTLTPVAAGSLIALLVLVGLWRRRASQTSSPEIEGLPPINVKFNLDLPEFESREPAERGYIHEVARHADDSHHHEHAGVDDAHHDDQPLNDHEHESPARPTMQMPDISLDLDDHDHHPVQDPDEDQAHHQPSPYQVRIDLAEELWNLGQLHTSRALMEEVAHEASGADKEKALKWLAERG
jgi:FimV-like protein